MKETIVLTEAEQAAKDYLWKCVFDGYAQTCDTDIDETFEKPQWYDDIKYKRAQKYFQKNRIGILGSNFCGLLTLLAEPTSVKVLVATDKSSTPETARRRYISTILHTICWYDSPLEPGSKSWESLKKIRRMHKNASITAKSKNMGKISQTELALTTFGFMGIALIRPQYLGIQYDNQQDREAFVHLWAVLCHMLGVKEQFNLCLLPFEAVEIACQLILRHAFIPFLLYEDETFTKMANAIVNGLSDFMPTISLNYQMYRVKYILGVPGYQYYSDEEKTYPKVLSKSELEKLQEHMLERAGLTLGDLNDKCLKDDENINGCANYKICKKCAVWSEMFSNKSKLFKAVMIGDLDLKPMMCDFYLHQMTVSEKICFVLNELFLYFYRFEIGRYLLEQGFNLTLLHFRRFEKNANAKTMDILK